MGNAALVTSTVSGASSGLTQLDYTALENVPEWEAKAYGHWLFDRGDATNLTDRVNQRVLTLQGSAPTYGANYLTIGAYGNALQTDIADSTKEWTLFAVAYVPATYGMIGGTAVGATGAALLMSGADITSYAGGLGNLTADVSPNLVVTDWVCAGMAINHATAQARNVVGATATNSSTAEGAYTSSAVPVSIGNANWTGQGDYTTGGVSIAEAIVWDRALSADELLQVAARSRIRAIRRGITAR